MAPDILIIGAAVAFLMIFGGLAWAFIAGAAKLRGED